MFDTSLAAINSVTIRSSDLAAVLATLSNIFVSGDAWSASTSKHDTDGVYNLYVWCDNPIEIEKASEALKVYTARC